jgi:hypothetical protein
MTKEKLMTSPLNLTISFFEFIEQGEPVRLTYEKLIIMFSL